MGIVILIIDIDIINTKIYNRKAASYISACKHVPKPQAIHADLKETDSMLQYHHCSSHEIIF